MEMTRRQALITGTLGTLGMAHLSPARELTGNSSRPNQALETKKSSAVVRSGRSGKLTLLQINDSHGYLDLHWEWFPGPHGARYRQAGGYARIATLVKQIRQETGNRVLFYDNGDTFHGTYPVVQSKGETLVPIMNALGVDGMTVHWDFAYGPKHLKRLAAQLHYPVLAINVYHQNSGERFLAPYAVQEAGGLKVAVIGIASNIVDKTMPPHFSEGLRFTDGCQELPAMIEKVRDQERADLVVVLSHLGFPQDVELLARNPGVDVLLSGHTHHRLFKPVKQGDTLVLQSGCHGSFLGRLDLEVSNGKVVSYDHELLEVTPQIQPDAAVNAMVQEALKPYAEEAREIVGEISTGLNRNANLECTMDNFMLAAVKEAAGTPLAFCNGWRWGAPIKPGPVSRGELRNLLPWTVPISTVELTGQELLEMLEENLERTFSADPFKQLGGYVKRATGLTAYIKIENPPGTRIQKLFVGEEEVQPEKSYQAAYLTVQAVPAKYGRNRRDLPQDAQEAMLAFVRKHQPSSAEVQGCVVTN